jgi:hypothetical protein
MALTRFIDERQSEANALPGIFLRRGTTVPQWTLINRVSATLPDQVVFRPALAGGGAWQRLPQSPRRSVLTVSPPRLNAPDIPPLGAARRQVKEKANEML